MRTKMIAQALNILLAMIVFIMAYSLVVVMATLLSAAGLGFLVNIALGVLVACSIVYHITK
jgi:hypothetical protein